MKQLSDEQKRVMDAAYKAADDTVEYVSKKQRLYAAGAALLEHEELAKEDLAAKITTLEGYIEELQANRMNAAYVIETLRKENREQRINGSLGEAMMQAWETAPQSESGIVAMERALRVAAPVLEKDRDA